MKTLALCLVLINCSTLLFAQTQAKIDSLQAVLKTNLEPLEEVKTLNELLTLYSYFDSTHTAQCFEELFPKATKIQANAIISNAYFNYGWLLMERGNFDKSENFFETVQKYAQKAKHIQYEGMAYQGLGLIERQRGNYEEALKYQFQYL